MPHYEYAAVAPLAPALPAAGEGLAALFPLIAWAICLSLLYVWRRTIGALIEHLANLLDFGVGIRHLGHVHPFGLIVSGLREIDGAIQSALDAGAKATERATVYLFHKSLATFTAVGRELYHIAEDAGRALDTLIVHTIPHLVKVGVHRLEHDVKQQFAFGLKIEHALVRPLDRFAHRLEATVERDFGIARRGIDVTKRDLARAEKATARLGSRVTTLEKALGAALFTGLFVRTLERLGLKWLRCPSLGNIGRKTGCRGFKFLEDLLFGVIDVLVISDLCRITGLMIDAANSRPVRGALHAFIDGMDDLLRCRGHTRPAKFVVHEVDLPPAQAWAELPPVQADLPIAA